MLTGWRRACGPGVNGSVVAGGSIYLPFLTRFDNGLVRYPLVLVSSLTTSLILAVDVRGFAGLSNR